jgi:two-component system OmpR family response regulator
VRVLLVDDDPGIAHIASLALHRVGGFDVQVTDQADEALKAAASGGLSCVILDVMMPRVDGPTLFRRLRDLPNCRELPIIFLTAKVQTHEVERLMSLGAAGVISKPFDPMTLSVQVKEILGCRPTSCDGPPLPLRELWNKRSQDVRRELALLRVAVSTSRPDAAGLAHKLTGLCGTFGFSAAGMIASELEHQLLEPHGERSPHGAVELLSLVEQVEQLLFDRTS